MYCNTIDTIQKSDYLQFTFQKPNETTKSFLKHGYEVTHYSDNKSTNTTISYLNFSRENRVELIQFFCDLAGVTNG